MLLPAPERRSEIQFHFAKGLAYGTRLAIAFTLMTAGLILQVAMFTSPLTTRVLPGLALVLAGIAIQLPNGYRNIVGSETPSKAWRTARRQELERIIELNRRQKAWDEDVLDITSTRGCGVFAIGLILMVVLTFRLMMISEAAGLLIAANAAVCLVPFWITGIRSYLKKDQLTVKAEMLLAIDKAFQQSPPRSGETIQFQLQTAETGQGASLTPYDLKAHIAFEHAPSTFLGLQMQININSVQGTDYPYFYCVVVAKKEFGGLARPEAPPDTFDVEESAEADVDVLVIRQHTTKKSGYHTNAKQAVRVFEYALAQARANAASRPKV